MQIFMASGQPQFFSQADTLQHAAATVSGLFVGEGWHLTLGALFMIVVIFLPGGIMEGINRLGNLARRIFGRGSGPASGGAAPAGQEG